MTGNEHIPPLEKIPTGVEGLDDITMGGITKGRPTLIAGTSGSGKTLLSTEILYRAVAERGKKAVFVTFEERAVDITRNVRRLNWPLDQLVREGRLAMIDASPEPVHVEETGAYDLSGLTTQVRAAIQRLGAEFVVLDSIGSLFNQFRDESVVRLELFRITDMLKQMGVTALLTAERLDEYGHITRLGVEDFVSDNVIVLRNVLDDERCRRTIQILKMRGEVHYKGEFPFTITDRGISVVQLAAMEMLQTSSKERISTGSKELDEMTHGGLYKDAIALVSGPTGSGKTLLCTTFAAEACTNGEKILMYAFEESRSQLIRNAESWGYDFEKMEADGLLRIVCSVPESMGMEDHLLAIRRQIDDFQPHRLVVDSVTAVGRVSSHRGFREFIIGLATSCRRDGIAAFITATTPRLSGGYSVTEAHISTITDAIILLRYVELHGSLRRGIATIKMRGSQHQKQIREFVIDENGLHIGDPFKNVHSIILGMPQTSDFDEEANLGGMFDE